MNLLVARIGTTLRTDGLRAILFKQFIADFQRNPPSVTKGKFWEGMLVVLKEHWHQELFGIRNPKNMKWQLPNEKEIIFEFERIRRIYEDQFRRLEKDGASHVYHEGLGAHPLKSYALRLLGLGFCDLDRRSYSRYLSPEEQRERERLDWLPKIKPSPSIEKARLVVGRNHAYDRYGLVGALEERGVRVDIEVDYKNI